MKRIRIVFLALVLSQTSIWDQGSVNGCAFAFQKQSALKKNQTLRRHQPVFKSSIQLEGVYKLISYKIIFVKPSNYSENFSYPEWTGIWILKKGKFSMNLMKSKRSMWISEFPKTPQELGFDSMAGSYKIKGNTIQFIKELSLSPQWVSYSEFYTFEAEKNLLILRKKLNPYPENISEGECKITLERIR